MNIYPAIDLYQGKVVRLQQGDYARIKVYSDRPAEVAARWVGEGAQWLHVVDLEGAKSGQLQNLAVLPGIVQLQGVKVQFGGGVRSSQDIQKLLELGVSRVIVGTKALDRNFLLEITQKYAGRIAAGLDLRGNEVKVEGWTKGSGISIFKLLTELRGLPLSCLIVTDIEKDGMLTGVNLSKWSDLLAQSPHPLICSGGISQTADLEGLLDIEKRTGKNLEGAIIGKALYEGRINLKAAIKLAKQTAPPGEKRGAVK